MKEFIIVVDAQYDFMMPSGALYVKDAERTIVPGIKFLAELQPETTAGVLFTFDTHHEDTYSSMPESKLFPIHCVEGTTGWENVFNANLIHGEIPIHMLTKGVFNMWEEDNVTVTTIEDVFGVDTRMVRRDVFFERLKADGVTAVVVIGVAADYCVSWTVRGLVDRGFHVAIPETLTVGITRQLEQTVAEDFPEGNVTVIVTP